MNPMIDPSSADESDPESAIPRLDKHDRCRGWRPWTGLCRYDRERIPCERAAQLARIACIAAIAKSAIADAEKASRLFKSTDRARTRSRGDPGRNARVP
jgi:hypothetical protein